jgi:hypothetical protein
MLRVGSSCLFTSKEKSSAVLEISGMHLEDKK